MTALVYGITRGAEHGWTDAVTIGSFIVAAILVPVFVWLQARSNDPLLPVRLFDDRNRTGSYLAMTLLAFGPMGAFYLLTLYMQHIVGYSPLFTGLAWLPFGAGIVLGAAISSKLVLTKAPRAVAAPGMLLAASALCWLSWIDVEPSYLVGVLPAIFALAFGFAIGVVSLTLTAVNGVRDQDSGIASALLNASQQIGVALGLAVLSSISVTTTARRMPNALESLHQGRSAGDAGLVQAASGALVEGYSIGLLAGAAALVVAAVITIMLVTVRRAELSAPIS